MFGAAGAQSLAGMLQVNRALNTLDLSKNNIGGVSDLVTKDKLQGTSFKKGDTVQYNGQQCIVFKEEDDNGDLTVQDMSGVIALAESLKFNSALNSVDLRFNQIPDEGKQQLRDAVKGKNIKLELLSSSHLPCEFQSAEWEGFYHIRSRREN